MAREVLQKYPETETVVCQLGRPESGTDPIGFYSAEFFVPLKPFETWPATTPTQGWRRWFAANRPRTKPELIRDISAELEELLPGVNWNFSQVIRDNVLEVLSGVQGENSVKIIGPDLDMLEKLGQQAVAVMRGVPGVKDVGLYRIQGQCNLELPIDREKCSLFNVSVADVNNVIAAAIGGKKVSDMIEGEKTFDIIVRWPQRLRQDQNDILSIPVDVTDQRVTEGFTGGAGATPLSGASQRVASIGSSSALPSLTGSRSTSLDISNSPRERLADLVTPLTADPDLDTLDPQGDFVQPGASMITREMGNRMVAVKFSVRGRDLGGTVAEAQQRVAPLIPQGYRVDWSGEFQQMEEGERRLMVIIPVSLVLIFMLLYLAFRSLLDAVVVLMNVVELSLGGLWALYLTGTNFSIAAAVGFASIFGVAVMDGLLLVSSFNQLRLQGLPLREAILQGAERRVRPVMMTALAREDGVSRLPLSAPLRRLLGLSRAA
ncbi:MAG: hypothetical protein B7Z73_15380 [Planctomycetia bacterium 21-64-5]|nr:MAG: hypothetical protein B7Z73_15380 [Planctomycetia bacterium 21-64-5]